MALLIAASILSLPGCSRAKDHSSAGNGRDTAATAQKRDLDFVVEAVGDLRPVVQVDVKAEVSGRIKKIHATTGQLLRKGDLLLELDDTDLLTEKASAQTEIDGARLQLKKADLAAEITQQLLPEGVVSRNEADNKKIDAEIAANDLIKTEKRLQTVEDKLTKTRIPAPIDGTVIVLPVVEGQVVIGGPSVSAGTLLMTMANLEEMLITTHINQIDVTRMEAGGKVEVTVDAFEGMKLAGKISFIAPLATVKNNIKGFSVDILVKRSDRRIRPGMSANIKVPIAKADAVLTVPVEAVFREADKTVVYLLNGADMERREVSVGLVTTDHAEIKSGLKEGDTVSMSRPKRDERKG